MATIRITPLQNLYIQTGLSGTDENFSTDVRLLTKTASTYTRRILLSFDVSRVPSDMVVRQAILHLNLRAASSATPRTLEIWTLTQPFTGSDVTWRSFAGAQRWTTPGGDLGSRVGSVSVGTTPGWVDIDVLPAVRAAYATGTRLVWLAVLDASSPSTGSNREWGSTRSAYGPSLEVTYGAVVGPSPLTVAQWNVHRGIGQDGVHNLTRTADTLIRLNADVISLNETSWYGWSNDGVNMPQWLADYLRQKTGQPWEANRAAGIGDLSRGFGNTVLHRLPSMGTATKVLTPSSKEGRVVLQVAVTLGTFIVRIFSTHVEYFESSVRPTQIREVRDWAATFPEPRILMGDFNSNPDSSDYHILKDAGYTDAWASARAAGTGSAYNGTGNTHGGSRFDYIWLRGLPTIQSVRVPDTRVGGIFPSDHDPVVATVQG